MTFISRFLAAALLTLASLASHAQAPQPPEVAAKAYDMFPADDAGGDRSTEEAGDGLGDSTATPPAKRGRAQAKDGAEHDGALPLQPGTGG